MYACIVRSLSLNTRFSSQQRRRRPSPRLSLSWHTGFVVLIRQLFNDRGGAVAQKDGSFGCRAPLLLRPRPPQVHLTECIY